MIDAPTGLQASFMSSDDLLTGQLAAGRPEDLADVAALRRVAKK
jgi:hypothetical protein